MPQTTPKHLDLTIRATNGAGWEHRFKPDDTVDEVIDRAVRHFVAKKIMAPGEYDLALIADGVAQPPLNPSDRLRDTAVRDESVLVLVNRQPQVDG
jgi:hypothetical protein